MNIAIITINTPSLNSAIKLNNYLTKYETMIYTSQKTVIKDIKNYDKLNNLISNIWDKYDAIIFIMATGAVIRSIAPFLQDKQTDPAILVINLDLNKIIPLIGGHLGGANELSEKISEILPNCINFISTATDQTNTLSFDIEAKKNNWEIKNIEVLANISNRLLNKQDITVFTYQNIFNNLSNKKNLNFINIKDNKKNNFNKKNCVIISPLIQSDNLILKPKISLGIGCNRNTSYQKINNAFLDFLQYHNLKISDIKDISSFEAKKDEKGLLKFALKYNFDIKFYEKEDINKLEQNFSKSASTKFFGLKGVAEPSAVLSSYYNELIITKNIFYNEITIAGAI